MKLMLDIEEIERIAKEKRSENKIFRAFLETCDSKGIDDLVHRLSEEITPKIDCAECGYCCNNIRTVADENVLRLYVAEENIEKYKYAWGFKCKNLEGTKCKIYQNRYDECRLYPYLDQNDFISRMPGVLQNYEICPIVFNVVEQLKAELNWK